MLKSPEAFRTISEVAESLDVPPHVLRFWETRFAQVKPVKRGGGRRYYRPEDVRLLRGIRGLLYDDGMTIKGVQKILRERGVRHVIGLGTVGDADDAPPVRRDAAATVLEDFDMDGYDGDIQDAATDDGRGDGGPVDDLPVDDLPGAADAASGTAPEPVSHPGREVPAAVGGAGVGGGQADLFNTAAAGPAADTNTLRGLIGRLEALRAVMTEGR
ncbi:MAG: MerR family transcriptional regulator [Amaricoccus sp.]